MIRKLIVIFVFAIMIIFMFSQIHEVTHYQIGKYNGCDGTIKWNFLDVNTTITEMALGEQTAFMSTVWDSNCQMSEVQISEHSMNEIIGYNVVPLLEIILIMIFTFIIMNTRPEEIKRKTKTVDIK